MSEFTKMVCGVLLCSQLAACSTCVRTNSDSQVTRDRVSTSASREERSCEESLEFTKRVGSIVQILGAFLGMAVVLSAASSRSN